MMDVRAPLRLRILVNFDLLSFIIPTRDRPERLARTLRALGALSARDLARAGGAEVVVADNASVPPAAAPTALDNGLPVRVLHLPRNFGAAGRNHAAEAARGEWLVMLDDDSHPVNGGFIDALLDASPDVAAIAAEIFLPDGARESGGLPEVFVGCAACVRRAAFLDAGGYDQSFHFYAEEYDLCARLLLAGARVEFDRRFCAFHEKTSAGRSMPAILRNLTRNNAWVAARYAPQSERRREIRRTVRRYGAIALRERAEIGWLLGAGEMALSLRRQPRRQMPPSIWARFTGLTHAREALRASEAAQRGQRVALIHRGKNDWAVEQALRDMDAQIVPDARDADALVVATLSPGPMLDALELARARESAGAGRPVIAPWLAATPRGASRIAESSRSAAARAPAPSTMCA